MNVRSPIAVLVPGLGSPHLLTSCADDFAREMILGQDVTRVRLGERLED